MLLVVLQKRLLITCFSSRKANERAEGKKKASDIRSKNSVAGSAATIAGQLEDLEMDELPMVKIGDAR